MSAKNLLKNTLSLSLAVIFLAADILISTALTAFETQYDYEESYPAWLTDLVIKEDMVTVEGMAQRVSLIPVPEYPYTETPESFRKDVEYFTSLYNLKSGSQRAGYLYFFEILNAESELIAGDVSDADIKEYLEGIGIKYPENVGSDELVMARALFTALVTGNVNGNLFVSGASLEEVLVTYMSKLTGMNVEELEDWMPSGSILSLDEYILAASKLALWSNGYEVSVDTPEDEVYRLVAVMTVKSRGLSVDANLPFEELNVKYIAALLSEKYSVAVDSEKLGIAIENDNVPYYVLQLIGKQNGLSLREDNAVFEDAFYLVAENSDAFDVEADEFYADITLYDAYLQKRCSSLWIYPTAYLTGRDNSSVVITVNGVAVRNNYYNEIVIDPETQIQELIIEVTAIEKDETYSFSYTVRVHQGTYAPVEGDDPVSGDTGVEFAPSDAIILDILAALNVNIDVTDLLNGVIGSVPSYTSDIASYIAPSFGGKTESTASDSGENENDGFYLGLLDEICAGEDWLIDYIPGVDFSDGFSEDGFSAVTFG